MAALHQRESETYRVIAFRRDQAEILLIPDHSGFQLPEVGIPNGQRVAENLCAAMKGKWGCDGVCLFSLQDLPKDSLSGYLCQVLECWEEPGTSANNAVWVPIHSLNAHSFQNTEGYAAFEQFLTVSDSADLDPASPFAYAGWFRELQGWISDVLKPLGLELKERIRQLSATRSSSLIRFETTGPAVWFKAAGEPNRHEYGITLKLAEWFPKHLPGIIGTRPEWNGWLTFEAEGTELGQTQETRLWETAAAELARLQLDSRHRLIEIASSGARDLTNGTLSTCVTPFFGIVARLMERQPNVPPPVLSTNELVCLADVIQESVAQIGDLVLPDTLGHLDLNPGNVIASLDRCAFLDWAEAYIGNPVLSFQHLLEHYRRCVNGDRVAEGRLTSAYIGQWHGWIPSTVLNEALQMSPLIAIFAYAVGHDSWRDEERLNDPAAAAYLRSLARRMNYEANRLNQRGSPCLC